tara:strand:+ start:19867 stop:24648 length:4782 start_codon:yes stop_codon:yes gene_type:complete
MAFGETLSKVSSRVPANDFGHEIELEDLNKKMQEFSDQINGKDLKSDCDTEAADALEQAVQEEKAQASLERQSQIEEVEAAVAEGGLSEEVAEAVVEELDDSGALKTEIDEEALQDEWQKYLTTLKTNACGQYIYTWDPEKPAEEVKECEPKRQKGMIELIAEKTIQDEVDEKPLSLMKRNDPKIRKLHKDAEYMQEEVRKYLVDSKVKLEERQKLLLNYIDQVALSFRDLIVIRRAYVKEEYDGIHFYESLLPDFPQEIYAGSQEMMDKLNMGIDPSNRPFHLKVEERKWGRARLRFRRNEVISRDIMTLMKAPTTKNYVRSLKWMTLHMMFSQIFIYDTMIGSQKPISVPKSCQNHLNGDFPEQFNFEFVEGQGDQFVDNLLASHGLIFSNDNYQFLEYYMDSVDKDPTKDGYSGLMPFEQYKYAKMALDEDNKIRPDLDDVTHFDTAFGIGMSKAMSVFKKGTFTWLGLKDEKKYTYKGVELFEKIAAKPTQMDVYEVKDEDGELVEINFERQNLSVFLAELMERRNVTHYEDLISDAMKNKLENTQVKIDMPSLYGSSVWRAWALRSLGDWAIEANARNIKANSVEGKAVCSIVDYSGGSYSGSFKENACDEKTFKSKLDRLVKTLGPYSVIDTHIPLRRLQEDKIVEIYPELQKIWRKLRDNTSKLTVAKPNEYNFLMNQMAALNPWARVRLSYLLAMEELKNFKSGYEPKYTTTSRGRKVYDYSQNQCFFRNINSISSKMAEAAKEMGIHRPLTPNYANKILDEDEKKYVWQDYLDSANDANSQLFKVESNKDKSYYDVLEKISYQTFLTKDEVESFTQSELPFGASRQLKLELSRVYESEEAKVGDFFKGLYDMKGNPEEQAEIFQAFSEDNGIDNEFIAKLNFLALDNSYKRPIYKEMIKEAAVKRKNAVQANLDEFCTLEDDDHARRKTLFYMTSKHQNQLNQMAGLPAVPENVLDEINSMSPAEWVDLKLGLGAGLLGVAAILIGGLCTGLTGGLCAPLGVGIMAMGATALGMQVNLVSREFDRKKEADVYEAKVKNFERLGYSTTGSSDNVSRGWFWTIFETICIIPLIGVVARTTKVGSKMAYVTSKTFLRNIGRTGFKNAWKTAGKGGQLARQAVDVSYARFVLGFDDISKELSRLGSSSTEAMRVIDEFGAKLLNSGVSKAKVADAIADLRKLHYLRNSGKITSAAFSKGFGKIVYGLRAVIKGTGKEAIEYTSKVVVKESTKKINRQTAEVVARYWGNNPKALKYLMSTYSKKLDKAAKFMKLLDDTKPFKIKDIPLLGKIPLLNKISLIHLGPTKFGKVPLLGPAWNAIKKMRYEHLAKYATKIKNLEKGLAGIAKNGGRLDNFIYANIEDLTDVFMKIPMRRREIPYIFLLQGGPHVGGIMKGARIPIIYGFSDGIMMRKFFNARGRLVYESMKAQARTTLGISKNVAAETTFGAFAHFQQAVANAAEDIGQEKGTQLIKRYGDLEEKIAEKFAKRLASSGKEAKFKMQGETIILTPENFKKVLFHPETLGEKAVAESIWSSLDVDDVFDMKEMGDLAHRVMKELSDYKGMDDFDDFLKALKILVIHRDPGVVEIM